MTVDTSAAQAQGTQKITNPVPANGQAAFMSTDALATYAKPHTVESSKLASVQLSASPATVRVRKANVSEATSQVHGQIPPAAAVYEMALGLRERGWQFGQVLSNIRSLFQRLLRLPSSCDLPTLKSITSLHSGGSLSIVFGSASGLVLFGEFARLIAIAYHIELDLVFHEINDVHCLHMIGFNSCAIGRANSSL